MSKTVALIPARGGSKGLPGKNTRLLNGKPLIHYTIEAALLAGVIDEVYVSTDDPAIAACAEQAGATLAPLRPAHLATDEATTQEVIRHFLDWYPSQFEAPETLVLLQPTSPLRNAQHIREALLTYQRHPQPASLVSVCPVKPVVWQGQIDSDGCFQRYDLYELATNRQQQAQNYIVNGAIYCTSVERAYEHGFLTEPVYPFVMPVEASVDIDTLLDFQLAELLLQNQNAPLPNPTVLQEV